MPTRLAPTPVSSVGDFSLPARGERSFKNQFANIYWLRLVALRKAVLERAREMWGAVEGGKVVHVPRVLDMTTGKLCYIVGTVYVDMAGKPNVLEDLEKELFVTTATEREAFWGEGDEVMLEDESGRVRLVGEKITGHVGGFVTGTIMAALGIETPGGDFEVVDICFPGLQKPPKKDPEDIPDESIAFVSGLHIQGRGTDELMANIRLSLLEEVLVGEASGLNEAELASITRLVIAGNVISPTMISEDERRRTYVANNAANSYSNVPRETFAAFLASVGDSIDVDVLPGSEDPTPPLLPQPPLHPGLFPGISTGVTFRTNPYSCQIGSRRLLGSSGQTLDDVVRYLSTHDRLLAAEKTLEWAHLAPSAPDTLACYPFTDRDPFIVESAPDLYFVGNQPEFATTMTPSGTRIILVPCFSKTGEVVIVNLRTLDVRVVRVLPEGV